MNNIITYRIEMDEKRHPFLVAEKTIEYSITCIDSPERAVNLVNSIFRLNHLAEEMVYMIAMDFKCKILGIFNVSHGTVNKTICNPREIFIRALVSGASSIIIIHNHPSGDSNPSNSDIVTYKNLEEISKIIGIDLVDFIIVGDDYFSFNNNQII